MNYEHILIDVEGAVAAVTINRPEVLNAIDDRTIEELTDAFGHLGASPKSSKIGCSIRVIVLKGAGENFCAGADLRWMKRAAAYPPAKNKRDAQKLVKMIQAIDESPVPVIARVQGGTYGGGLGIIAACDVVVAGETAKMCFSECRLGFLPAVVSTFVLPKIGVTHARRLYLTSELFGMPTAQRIGLVHDVVPDRDLDTAVRKYVRLVLKNGPEAVKMTKTYLRKMAALTRPGRLKLSVETLVKARSAAEAKEGFAAFLEKRPASWVPDQDA